MSSAEDVVRRFCEAWSRRDVDELLSFFADDAVYHNIPLDPATGREAIRDVLNLFVPLSEQITFEVTHVASAGDVVLTERVDRFRMNGKDVVIPAAGIFEIEAGKIRAWRDYFDLQTWMQQTTG